MLSDSDPCVDLLDPDWKDTQTVPPTNVQIASATADSIELSWLPILYQADGGNYQVKYGTTSGTYDTAGCTTNDKTETGCTIIGLASSTTYYLAVQTYTPQHGDQQNNLLSEFSSEVLGVTNTGTSSTQPTIFVSDNAAGNVVAQFDVNGNYIDSFSVFSSGNGPNISTGDIDNDNVDELVVAKNSGGNQMVMWEADGTLIRYFGAGTADGFNVAVCDLDGDGVDDEIVAGKKDSNVAVLFNTDGTYNGYFVAFTTGTGVNVACGNVDVDPEDEIIIGKASGGTQVVLFEPTGTYIRYFTAFTVGSGVNVTGGDVDGDGLDEVIVGKENRRK